MAEREVCKNVVEGVTTTELSAAQIEERETDAESSASEYEEIIEEVTDYSDADEEAVVSVKVNEPNSKASASNSTAKQEAIKVSKVEVETEKKEEHKSTVEVAAKPESRLEHSVEEPDSKSGQKGESLMPLLQDLLHKNMPQIQQNDTKTATQYNSKTSETTTNSTNTRTGRIGDSISRKSSSNTNPPNNTDLKGQNTKDFRKPLTIDDATRLSVPQREDSGTESGEDLRLIAAGIRDKLHMQSDTNLIEEVTTALNRLESSLKEGKDISLDERKRNALLALVARLQTGLISPEKLADSTLASIAAADACVKDDTMSGNCEETSSPEADEHRTNRQRFAKRRNRNNRHTVGVSREELEDARRYMEDMLLMENISNCTTPDSNTAQQQPPSFPIVKNASSGAIMLAQPASNLYRPNQFVPNSLKNSTEYQRVDKVSSLKNTHKRPLSGEYNVSFDESSIEQNEDRESITQPERETSDRSPESASKSNRFSNKKLLMKRANTIDIPKNKNYTAEFEADSDADDKNAAQGLKRGVQVTVKQKVRNVVPPFEPKTENDHKFLAFINKQSAKPGLGWNNSKSVSNWTNKFGNIKNTFEVGAAASVTTGKPPLAPGHMAQNAAKNHWQKQAQQMPNHEEDYAAKARMQRSQQEVAERRRKLEGERLERDRQEREHLERERLKREYLQREQLEREHLDRERRKREQIDRERLEREHLDRERHERENLNRERFEREQFEREHLEHLRREQQAKERLIKEQLEREYRERERLERERVQSASQPMPVNQFIHAPQSVFRPIDTNELQPQNIIKPIAAYKTNNKAHTWQSPKLDHPHAINSESPQYLAHKYKGSTSVSSCSTSPIGLPWLSKQPNSAALKQRAHKFEDKPQMEASIYRQNSLRSNNGNKHLIEQHRKRPSLPNTTEPHLLGHNYQPEGTYYTNPIYPPPPTNISFTYTDYAPIPSLNYQSYPCLSTALANEHLPRSRQDSLTNPQAEPLVLSSTNPLYSSQNLAPNAYQRQFDYASPLDSAPTSPSFMSMPQTDYTDDDLDSDCNIMEYRVESKVMKKPQVQKAVTVGRRTNHVSDDEVYGKNSRAARSLLHTIKNLNNNGNNNGEQKPLSRKRPEQQPSPKVCLSPDGRSYQAPLVEPLFPQLTNFEQDRSPLYLGQNSSKSASLQCLPTHYHQNPMYVSPSPLNDGNSKSQQYQVPRNEPPNPVFTKPTSLETYPSQRPANVATSNAYNMNKGYTNVPPNASSWSPNAMHMDEMRREIPHHPRTESAPLREIYRPLQQQSPAQNQHQSIGNAKPEVRPKPQLPPLNTKTPYIINQTAAPKPQSQPEPQIQRQPQPQFTQMPQQQLKTQPKLDRADIVDKQTHIKTQQYGTQSTQQKELHAIDVRRKSLGNILDMQQQQNRKSDSFDYIQRSQQEYKSSAPMDTPDIVKSSLPRDENMPILKKFGPPQRHHYVPNSYQSPNTNTTSTTSNQNQLQTRQIEANTRVKLSTQKVVQHSSFTSKPTIVNTPATPQDQEPESMEELIPRNIVYNNISAFSSMSRRNEVEPQHIAKSQNQPNRLSKCDSWSQIVQQQSQYTATPAANSGTATGTELRRSKSGHSLALPKMFEAGIDKAVVNEKQKTVAAYFGTNEAEQKVQTSNMATAQKRTTINRTKTAAKVSAASRKSLTSISAYSNVANSGGSGLARSATMPHIANLNLLDESNVEDAFEQLMLGS